MRYTLSCNRELEADVNGKQLDVVVLAGGKPGEVLALAHNVPVKALIPINGHPMSWYVLKALRSSGVVKKIVYVGPSLPELEGLYDIHLPARGEMLENLEAGLAALPGSDRIMVATADIPLLSPEAVRDVVSRDSGIGLVYPIISETTCKRAFPGGKRTYAKVRNGKFTGGNLFLLEPGLIGAFMPKLKQVINNRKNPLAIASMIGLDTLLKFPFGLLTIPELEQKISKILGVPASALITEFAEVGFDVDKPEDLELTLQKLRT
jgi:GTP:adenosylcobinamide-phosphate guanylyltransferase